MPTPLSILQHYWGYEAFRPLQKEIIGAVLEGKDTLALLPTGGGKSICYQVPALMSSGLTLVVSPLIALMQDQVDALRKRGVMALAIYAGMSRRAVAQSLLNAGSGEYKLLYVSPERLETETFKEYLPGLGVSLIAVDEAHCISQWGYDFRPAYLKIAALREELPNVPVLALTASATADVERDICEKLGFVQHQIFRQSYRRPNLSYSVLEPESKSAKLVDIVRKVPGTAIVYCGSRRRTVEMANLLTMHGFSAQYYHAGLSPVERAERQEAWINNKVRIIVSTNAFGMGIDKPDVRLVVHMDAPDSPEAYYQEAGRAGRDGKKSYAVLLCKEADRNALTRLPAKRFPSEATIRHHYAALVNYLQVPTGSGEDQGYTFLFTPWVKAFKLDPIEALYALKALEGEEWLQFHEQSFLPPTVVFTTSKVALAQYEDAHPHTEPVLTHLLRTCEGIWSFPAVVSERGIAVALRMEEAAVVAILQHAVAHRIIGYRPQNNDPQIWFRKQRVRVEDLRLNLTAYHNRKGAYEARVAAMIAYTREAGCRSAYLNTYFGDATPPCGVCDNCVRPPEGKLDGDTYRSIQAQILMPLEEGSKPPAVLLQAARKHAPAMVWTVIRHLQSEGLLLATEEGHLYLKKNAT